MGSPAVTLHTVSMDADVIVVLRRLAESCQDAAGSAAELAERYGALRAEAMALNEQRGWATADDLAAQLPSLEELIAIESLDRAFGETSAPDLPVERGTEARLTEALIQLAGWATGVRLAYGTLREMDPPRSP
jgi:hypothetical protein